MESLLRRAIGFDGRPTCEKANVRFPPDAGTKFVVTRIVKTFAIRPLDSTVADQLRKGSSPLIYVADEQPGYPCRECLRDANVGEEPILVSYDPFEKDSPYRPSSPIFIHLRSCSNNTDRSEVPMQLQRRQLSVRAFDSREMMIDAKVIQGSELGLLLQSLFEPEETSYVDIHNASRGCCAATARRIM